LLILNQSPMKKLSSFLVAIAICHFAFSQAPRKVLVEEFTQASCPPCASQNPDFDALLLSNPETVVTLKYHTDWPGIDEMNAQNPSDVQTRVTYYGINGVPMGAMDGFVWPDYDGYSASNPEYAGAPYQCSQDLIDSMEAITSPFTMSVTHWFSSDYDSIFATVTIDAAGPASGNLVAQVGVIEKEVVFGAPPGSNGETEFDGVLKKMLPNASGTALATSWSTGDTYSFTVSWKLTNVYDMNQLAVVAFIQNNTGKAVLQSAYSVPQQLPNLAVVTSLTAPVLTCDGNVTPSIVLENTGSAVLTDATITVNVDNVAASTYSWTGSLNSNQLSSAITLPTLSLTPGGHNLSAVVSNANGTALNAGVIIHQTAVISDGTPILSPIVEGFTNTAFPPANWGVNNADGDDLTWVRTTTTGAFQETPYNAAKYYNYLTPEGFYDELFMQNFDLSDATQTEATLNFAIAKAKYTGYSDKLEVLVSADCGTTWTSVYNKTDNSGLYTATSTADWKPSSASQWRTDVIDMSSFIGNSNVVVKFKATSGYGNNMYIDNINLFYGTTTGISEVGNISVELFPNPANEMTVIQINSPVPANSRIEFVNMLGQRIYSAEAKSNSAIQVNTSSWEAGMYIYRMISSEGNVINQDKLNVTH
jgi:hypothetical protein